MSMKAILLCKNLVTKLLSSLKRFPEAILLAASTVSILILLNHYDSYARKETEELFIRIAMVLALGVPLSLCIKVFFERVPFLKKSIKTLIYIAATAGLLLYYLFLLKDFGMVSISRYIAFSISFYFAFAFIPYFYRRENYELYVIKLFTRFFISYLYSLILYAGLSAMLFTIDRLFSAGISGKLYFDIWLIVAGVFAPAFFLADIPGYGQEFHVESYPKVIRVLLLYIVMPMIVAYSSILYVYFAKIIVTRQWPEGIVSNLVLWYSIISTLVIFLVYPLRTINQWARAFVYLFPKLILPLLAMMFVAMGIRINAYGITENRYFVMLAGLWVTGCMVYFNFIKNARNIVLPISIALISILSVSGPWSSYSVSKLSQNIRFEKILDKYDMVKDGSITRPSRDLSSEDRKEISAIILYFNKYHSLNDIKYLPEGFKIDQMKDVFGFQLYDGNRGVHDKRYFSHNAVEEGVFLDIEGFDYFADFSPYKFTDFKTSGKPVHVSYTPQDKELRVLEQGKEIYSKNMEDIALKLHRENEGRDTFKKDEMTVLDQNEKVKVLYVFRHISGSENRWTGEVNIDHLEFYLFVKLNRD